MPNYDFDYFISTVKHLDYADMVEATQERLGKVPEKVKKGEVVQFGSRLRGLLSWLKTGKKPEGFFPSELEMLRDVGRNLVAKRQMKASAIVFH